MATSRPRLAFILVSVFLDMLGVGLMIPVLPSLVGTMTTSAGAQSFWYGALVVTYGGMQFLCSPLLGALSDRFGRRPILLVSVFGLGTSYLTYSFAHSLPLLLLARVASGATGASFSVANAYVADILPPEERGKGFGLLGAAFGVGFVFGPLVGGLLGSLNLRLPFFTAAALSLAGWIYGFFVLPESHPVERRAALTWARANPLGALVRLSRLRGAGGLVGAYALTTLAQLVLQTGWVLYTTFRFGWGPRQNGTALLVVGITAALVQGAFLGRLIKLLGERTLVLLGIGSSVVAYVATGYASVPWLLYVLIAANGLSFAVAPVLQSMISRSADASAQGVTMGALQGVSSVLVIVAPLVSAPVLAATARLPRDDWRFGALFYGCALLQLASLAATAIHLRRHSERPGHT